MLPLELVRSYNTITAVSEANGWNGAFGWGWTAPFETTLTTTPERHVILRDGGTGNTINFKPLKEDPNLKEQFLRSVKRAYFEAKKGRKIPEGELSTLQLPEKIQSKLKTDPQFRLELAGKYGITGAIPREELLISSEYGYQTMEFKNNRWIRERDGIVQWFDNDGHLIRQVDKNGFFFQFKYGNGQKQQLTEISDQDRTMSLKFTWRQDRVIEVTDNRGRRSRYTYEKSGNLTSVTDSHNQNFVYKYDNRKFPHLLTRVEYTSEGGAFREIKYDDNGLVAYHRDKDATETTYSYGKSTNDPENNFWTKSVKKAHGGSEEQYDEFFIKPRVDGSKYLYKQEERLGGVTTVTVYTACCGKPSQIVKNGEVTNYKYYDSGLLKERVGPKEDVRFEYDPRWKKVSMVSQNGFISKYEYDSRGNLIKASNSKNERVSLKYDPLGRILEMTDSLGKQIGFKYNPQGKPLFISEKGVGTIKVDYDPEGRIVKTETSAGSEKGARKPSAAKAQEVIRRVMGGFQNLLNIIRPASQSTAG